MVEPMDCINGKGETVEEAEKERESMRGDWRRTPFTK